MQEKTSANVPNVPESHESNVPERQDSDRSSLPACLEIINRGIAALSERKPDPFQNEIVDFASFVVGTLSQCFVDRFGQI
jgi:hypothetical protein